MSKIPSANLSATSIAQSSASESYVRLHITPLDPTLVNIIIPASVRSAARNISYHTLETFPESRYGFVELPEMEAEKIKKKLNGTTLKGSKIRIEKARPEKIPEPTSPEEETSAARKSSKKCKENSESSKKRKRDPEVIEGVDLQGRKVKRGWTVPDEVKIKEKRSKSHKEKGLKTKDKKRETKSKFTDKEELLFKTKLPRKPATGEAKEDSERVKKRKERSRETIVHEFEKTTKYPRFLKNNTATKGGAPATEFVEGKGWVDSEGNLVEAVKSRRSKALPPVPLPLSTAKQALNDENDTTSSSGTSSDDSESDAEPTTDEETTAPVLPSPITAIKADSSRPKSSSSNVSLTIKIPPVTPAPSKVHPLEALYKRPKPGVETPNAANSSSKPFSFFDSDDVDAPGTAPGNQMPMTPFTQMDIEWRNVRSAAPTPDTAHPGRTKPFWALEADDVDEEEEDGNEDEDQHDDDSAAATQDGDEDGDQVLPDSARKSSSSDFQKWFWENRKDLNQSWMKRRKTALKDKRHKENKARASRGV